LTTHATLKRGSKRKISQAAFASHQPEVRARYIVVLALEEEARNSAEILVKLEEVVLEVRL
jgi:hypothetical protein